MTNTTCLGPLSPLVSSEPYTLLTPQGAVNEMYESTSTVATGGDPHAAMKIAAGRRRQLARTCAGTLDSSSISGRRMGCELGCDRQAQLCSLASDRAARPLVRRTGRLGSAGTAAEMAACTRNSGAFGEGEVRPVTLITAISASPYLGIRRTDSVTSTCTRGRGYGYQLYTRTSRALRRTCIPNIVAL